MVRCLVRAAIAAAVLLAGIAAAAADECSDVHAGAQHTPSPNWNPPNPYPGACYAEWPATGAAERETLAERCRKTPGYQDFKPDRGSGRNTCIFKPSGAGETKTEERGSESQPSSPGAGTCQAGEKLCESRCIPDSASCCANGHGVYCAAHGQCCNNPSNPRSKNGYVCCETGEQCVYAEGPTAGKCVAPDAPKQSKPEQKSTPAPAKGRPSTFLRTCREIEIVLFDGAPALKANCRRVDQSEVMAVLSLRGIANKDGRLVRGRGASTFQKSCTNFDVRLDAEQVFLTARCKRIDGSVAEAELLLPGIENVDGALRQ